MPILNYTTSINVPKTVQEIQQRLANHGAETVSCEYASGKITAIKFMISVGATRVNFRLPCNIDGVMKAMQQAKVQRRYLNRDHAERVAWRIVKDWVVAQLALVEAQQAQIAEVFLPYATDTSGKVTMFQVFEQQAPRLLGAGDA